MKRLLLRAPVAHYSTAPKYSAQDQAALREFKYRPYHLRIVPPLATNISLSTEVLKSLKLNYFKSSRFQGNTKYELLTPEGCDVRVLGHPITRLTTWKEHVEHVLARAEHYPPFVFRVLLEECQNLVYEHPDTRRQLLDRIMDCLLDTEYPVTYTVYRYYLSAIQNMKQSVDLTKVFGDLTTLKLPLNYGTLEEMALSDVVCYFLGLDGDTEHIAQCWQSFTSNRNFRGFRDQSYAAVVTGHVMRGEFDETFELLATLERYELLRPTFLNYLGCSLAKTGHWELLDTLLKNKKYLSKLLTPQSLVSLYLETVESSSGAHYIPSLLSIFSGVNFEHGRTLQVFACDVLSRGHYDLGADLVVNGTQIFSLYGKKEKGIYENETIPDIMSNMGRDLDNIMIRLELRGINTRHHFNFDQISIPLEDLEGCEGLDENQDALIQELYNYKMSQK